LSFRPATIADEEALASIWPQGGEGDPSELPTSIPAHLIQVPELRVGDEVLLTGPAMNLGHEMTFVFTPEFAGRQVAPNTYSVIAGSYLAIAAIARNVSRAAILETQDRHRGDAKRAGER